MAGPDFSFSSSRRRQSAHSFSGEDSADYPRPLHPVGESCGAPNTRARWRFPAPLMAALLVLVTIALYWPARGYDFVNYDDPVYFSENQHVLAGLTWRNVAWAFHTTSDASWYPLSWLSFMLDATLFGRSPAGPHLTNMLLHAANGVLLFLLWKRLAGSFWRSALVAALFVLHPVHVESVAWVSERKDVLSGFFFMLTLWAYARYVEVQSPKSKVQSPESKVQSLKSKVQSPQTEGDARSAVPGSTFKVQGSRFKVRSSMFDVGCWMLNVRCSMFNIRPSSPRLWYWTAVGMFALGLMSKPMLVTLPFLLLLLDYWPLQRLRLKTLDFRLKTQDSRLKTVLLEKVPFVFLALIASAVTVAVHKQVGALTPLASVSMPARVANAFVSYARYLRRMLWPTNLALPYPLPGHWPLGWVCLAAALVAGCSVAAWWLGRRRPYLLVGWFWFLGTLVPVIGLLQWGNQAMADRFLYVPSIGLFVAVAWGLGELTERWRLPKPAVGSAAALVLLALAWRSSDQLRYWRNSVTLFRHTLAVTENNPLAHNNLGAALLKQGQTDAAIRQFQDAIRLAPEGANPHYNLGVALSIQGHTEAAITQFQEAVRLEPGSAATHYNLGVALGTEGQTEAAITQFQEAIRLQPAYPEALGSLAGALGGQGRYAEAIRFYHAALKAQPGETGVLNNLAWLLATCPDAAFRNGPEAVRLATRACGLTGYSQPLLIGTLAAAQAEAGDFKAAIATAERAAALAKSLHLEDIAARNRELLQLYRQGQPFHEKKGGQ